MWTSLLQERLSKAVKSPWKLFTPIWEPDRLSKGNKPYVIILCLFGEFYPVTFEHVGQFQLSLGSGEGLNVCRNGWLNRCDQCHHEGEDGSTSVALPEVHMHGRSSSGDSAAWSSSMSLQLWLLWSNTLCCMLPNAPTMARSCRCVVPPCLTSVQGYSRNSR